jgi:hypothetical protein
LRGNEASGLGYPGLEYVYAGDAARGIGQAGGSRESQMKAVLFAFCRLEVDSR